MQRTHVQEHNFCETKFKLYYTLGASRLYNEIKKKVTAKFKNN